MQHPDGTYIVVPWCRARDHNAKRGSYPSTRVRCVCPGGEMFYRQWRDARNEKYRRDDSLRERELRSMRLPLSERSQLVSTWTPDLRDGRCTQDDVQRKIAEGGIDVRLSINGFRAREAAKAQCRTCPVLNECAEWIERAESPAGSWGGVYGALDPWERRGTPIRWNTELRKVEVVSGDGTATGNDGPTNGGHGAASAETDAA